MLKVDKVSFSYKNYEVLQNVSMELKKGEIAGLIGDNGAGKSTLMKVMCGLKKADSGSIHTGGVRVGALIEDPAYYPTMTVQKNMEFFRVLYDATEEQRDEIMKITGLDRFLKEKANCLSIGMKKRLGLGIALLSSNDVVLLDEPTSGLDPSGIRDILQLIKKLSKEKGIAFLISSNIFQELESVCDTFYRLKDRKLWDIYSRPNVYGYSVQKDGMASDEIAMYLKKKNCPYILEDKKVYVTCEVCKKELKEQLQKDGLEVRKRRLAEVYYE